MSMRIKKVLKAVAWPVRRNDFTGLRDREGPFRVIANKSTSVMNPQFFYHPVDLSSIKNPLVYEVFPYGALKLTLFP